MPRDCPQFIDTDSFAREPVAGSGSRHTVGHTGFPTKHTYENVNSHADFQSMRLMLRKRDFGCFTGAFLVTNPPQDLAVTGASKRDRPALAFVYHLRYASLNTSVRTVCGAIRSRCAVVPLYHPRTPSAFAVK